MYNFTKRFTWVFALADPGGLLGAATLAPTMSLVPSSSPSSSVDPTRVPSLRPSSEPSSWPTRSATPSVEPSASIVPSVSPSVYPSVGPSLSVAPSYIPSASLMPSANPSGFPTASTVPSTEPSFSLLPSATPTDMPSVSKFPSNNPSFSSAPSSVPSSSLVPSSSPSSTPSFSSLPSGTPTETPMPSFSSAPSTLPSLSPTKAPEDRFNYRTTVGNDFGPADWGNVQCDEHSTCPGWPDDWETFNPYIPYEGTENFCMDCSSSARGSCKQHKQSPLHLLRNATAGRECKDRHWMHHSRGTCGFGQMRFTLESHTLRAYQPLDEYGQSTCQEPASIDYSMGFPDRWHLVYTDIKVPSEHMQDGKRYDAEVQLASIYSKNRSHRLIGKVAVFLEAEEGAKEYGQLSMYINRWRKTEKEVVDNCSRRRLGAFADPATREEYADFDLEDEDVFFEGIGGNETTAFGMGDSFGGARSSQRRLNKRFNAYDWLKKVETEYYFRYEGSQGVPPCLEVVHWRVMKEPIKVPQGQIDWIDKLTARRIDPDTCEKETAGKPRADGSGMVDVNRPVQLTTRSHKVVFCECIDWPSKKPQDQKWCNLTMEERGVQPYWKNV